MEWNDTALQDCVCSWAPGASPACLPLHEGEEAGCAAYAEEFLPVVVASAVPLLVLVLVFGCVLARLVYRCACGPRWSASAAKGEEAEAPGRGGHAPTRIALAVLFLYIVAGLVTSRYSDTVYADARRVAALVRNETMVATQVAAGFSDGMAGVAAQLGGGGAGVADAARVAHVVDAELKTVDAAAAGVVNNWVLIEGMLWTPCLGLLALVVALRARARPCTLVLVAFLISVASVGIFALQASAAVSSLVLEDACDDYAGVAEAAAAHFRAAFPGTDGDAAAARAALVAQSCAAPGALAAAPALSVSTLCTEYFSCGGGVPLCGKASFADVVRVVQSSVRRHDASQEAWGTCGAGCSPRACAAECAAGSPLQAAAAQLVANCDAAVGGAAAAARVGVALKQGGLVRDFAAAAAAPMCGGLSQRLKYLACLCGLGCLLAVGAGLLAAFTSLLPPQHTYYTLLGDGEFPSPHHHVASTIKKLPAGARPEGDNDDGAAAPPAGEGEKEYDSDEDGSSVVIGGLLKIGGRKWVMSKWAD
eukprot:TRINITY_DN5740_c0_g1_i1.p1 TRINITY_DN5740_c0_g1~~TRINITY_DN5740_c0_g1_i1.p1  ORF type:complete len:535 (+),score=212.69 TRINITY_DN5740_c0_g1_i1:61-1665(+)